jgi:hypothetical protein
MHGKRLALVLSFLILAGLGARNLAAQPVPLGPETRVDTFSGDSGFQYPSCPYLAVRPTGDFLIAWDHGGSLPPDVYARAYAAGGDPITPSQVFVGSQGYYPVVDSATVLSNGYRVLFHVVDDLGIDPLKFYRHRVEPSGKPVAGPPRPLGAADTLWVWPGPGEMLLAGRYAAGKKRMVAQKVAANGKPAGFNYILNTRPILDPFPTIVPVSDKRFVAAWTGYSVATGSTPARQVVRARLFSLSGPLGSDFDVNSVPAGAPGAFPFLNGGVVVAGDRFGGFAVAWSLSDSSSTSVHLRFFDDEGAPTSPEIVVASSAEVSIHPVAAAFDDSGNLLLLWRKFPTLDPDIQARVFDSSGSPLGAAFRVNSAASGDFDEPFCGSVGWAEDTWVITWAAQKPNESSAIFVRRFAG